MWISIQGASYPNSEKFNIEESDGYQSNSVDFV